MKTNVREGVQGYGFMLPAILILAIFTLFPIGFAFFLSFTRVNLMGGLDFDWIGFGNYQIAFNDHRVWTALRNTAWYTLLVVPAQTFFALVIAAVLNSGVKFQKTFRTIFFLPTLTSSAALTMIFMFLFSVNGPLNELLISVGFVDSPVHFIGEVNFVLYTIMVMNVWSTAPFYMTIYLAGLQDVDASLYEAASIDGANAWQKFTKITIPMLTPVTNYVLLIGIIGCFQMFDQSFIISGGSGGPANATLTVALVIYQFAFQIMGTMGYASALAILLTIIIFTVSMITRWLNKEEAMY